MSAPFAGRHALIAGAGGGIGAAFAAALAAGGAETWLVGRTREALEAAAAGAGSSARVRSTDLADDGQRRALLAQVEREAGGLDILVHAAGDARHGTFDDATVDDLDEQYRANVRVFYGLVHDALPLLRARGGDVVVVNSSVVDGARGGVGQYAAAKQAVRALTDALRQEVNDDGVRVLSVFPGRTATPLQQRLYEDAGREYRPELLLRPDDVAAIVVAALALPRTAEVTDIRIRPAIRSY